LLKTQPHMLIHGLYIIYPEDKSFNFPMKMLFK
jgi:hypothetical protein